MARRSGHLDPTALGGALEARGYRLTRQRRVVYDCLAAGDSHPTAETLYTSVKREIPNISLATVYKALESLVASGVARKLEYGDASARYDARTDEHQHTRCLSCGRVRDLAVPETIGAQISRLELPDRFTPAAVRIEVVGTCPDCA